MKTKVKQPPDIRYYRGFLVEARGNSEKTVARINDYWEVKRRENLKAATEKEEELTKKFSASHPHLWE